MPGTDISGAEFEAVSSEVNPGDGLIGMTEAEAAESEDWECPECQYDREESGDQPKPEYCPLCLSDSGHLVRIRYKK
jgi:rubrerythrin